MKKISQLAELGRAIQSTDVIPIVGVNEGTRKIAATQLFRLDSTTEGFLPPRMTTTQKNAIALPDEGLCVYDTTLHALCVYNGTAWQTVTAV
jgi:hypothetical protein